MPVIAEGVETGEQLIALKAMGCDIVQGDYFSKPIPASEYERFVVERMRRRREMGDGARDNRHIVIGVSNIDAQVFDEQRQSIATHSQIAQTLAADHFIEYSAYDEYAALGTEKGGAEKNADAGVNGHIAKPWTSATTACWMKPANHPGQAIKAQ